MNDLYLYHATNKKNLKSILSKGLLIHPPSHVYCNFDCENKIFLAFDPDVAESYAEEIYSENIVLLKVKLSDLDQDAFSYDWNVRCEYKDEISTCAYRKDIPPKYIQECKSFDEPYQTIDNFKGTYLYEILLDTFYYECETCQEENN